MHLEFFGFNDHPFRLTPDFKYLFLGKGHSRAKAYMEYTVWNRDSFVVITGEIGAGKTTLIKKLLSELSDEVVVAKIYQTQLDELEFLQALLVEFGFSPFTAKKVELLNMLNMFLIEQYSRGKRVVLIVDEAQNLSRRVLEEIRLLSGMETQHEKLLNVILAGQPELNDVLDSPGMEQLMQRVRLRFHLRALDPAETRAYVQHRVAVAGGDPETIFSEEVYPIIHDYSGGIPRLINTLCDTALICAFVDNQPQVVRETMATAVEELQWVPYGERRGRAPSQRSVAAPATPSAGPPVVAKGSGRVSSAPVLDQMEKFSDAVASEIRIMEQRLKEIAKELGME